MARNVTNAAQQPDRNRRTLEQTQRDLSGLLEQLDEEDPEARIAVWAEITRIIQTRPGAVTNEVVAVLLIAQSREKQRDDRVWRAAAEAISYAFFAMARATDTQNPAPQEPTAPGRSVRKAVTVWSMASLKSM